MLRSVNVEIVLIFVAVLRFSSIPSIEAGSYARKQPDYLANGIKKIYGMESRGYSGIGPTGFSEMGPGGFAEIGPGGFGCIGLGTGPTATVAPGSESLDGTGIPDMKAVRPGDFGGIRTLLPDGMTPANLDEIVPAAIHEPTKESSVGMRPADFHEMRPVEVVEPGDFAGIGHGGFVEMGPGCLSGIGSAMVPSAIVTPGSVSLRGTGLPDMSTMKPGPFEGTKPLHYDGMRPANLFGAFDAPTKEPSVGMRPADFNEIRTVDIPEIGGDSGPLTSSISDGFGLVANGAAETEAFNVIGPVGVAGMGPGGLGGMGPGGFAGMVPGGFAGIRPRGFAGIRPRGFAGIRPGGFAGIRPGGFAGIRPGGFAGIKRGGFAGIRPGDFAGLVLVCFGGMRPEDFVPIISEVGVGPFSKMYRQLLEESYP